MTTIQSSVDNIVSRANFSPSIDSHMIAIQELVDLEKSIMGNPCYKDRERCRITYSLQCLEFELQDMKCRKRKLEKNLQN
jgi:hypothetical protein